MCNLELNRLRDLQKDMSEGIDVCLTCFNGGCLDIDRHHARTHVQKSGHRFILNVKRKAKAKPKLAGRVRSHHHLYVFLKLGPVSRLRTKNLL